MASYKPPGYAASVKFIFLNFGGNIGDYSVESDNTSPLFMIFASLVCSIPPPPFAFIILEWMCVFYGLVSVGSSSKLFYFRKSFFKELEGRKQSSIL